MEFDFVNYIVFPLMIFFIRIADVSLGTIRIVFVSRDLRTFSAVLGFLEVLIWLFAITQIMKDINNPVQYVAYAAGFGMGNYLGITIERKLSMGNRIIQIFTKNYALELIKALREKGFGVTCIDGEGVEGSVKLIFSVVKRSKVEEVIAIARKFNPKAFFTVEEVKHVSDGGTRFVNNDRSFSIMSKFNRRR